MFKNNRSKRNPSKRAIANIVPRPLCPPQIAVTPQIHKVFRFTGSLAGNTTYNVLYSDILQYICVALDTTHVSNIFEACKLSRVEAWAAGGGGGNSFAIEFPVNNTALGAPSKRFVGSSLSTAQPIYIDARPAPNSEQAMWQKTSADVCFKVSGLPSGAISVLFDVHITYNMFDDVTAPTTRVVAGATAGSVYYSAMEASKVILPVELPTI